MNTVTRPDGPSLPRFVRGGMALAAPLWTMRRLRERYGSAFTVDVPILGKAVVISDPAEVKQLFTTSPEIADNLHLNLGRGLRGRSPRAWLTTMRGMGHDLPRGAWPALVNLIDDHIRAGAGRSADGQES